MRLLNLQEEEINTLDLGTLEAGKTETFTYILENETPAIVVELSISSINTEIEFVNVPDTLEPFSKATFNVVWKPSVDIKEALEAAIKIQGKALYKPKS